MSCIFCSIVNGQAPSRKILEDEYTLAFLDIANDVDGHTLVIPKKHVESILDCDDETLSRLVSSVKRVSKHYTDHCGYQGVDLLNASGEAAQQSVPHFHIHIIPRKDGDGIDAWPAFKGSTQALDKMHEMLKCP
jgi:histidine triad (HIT) family protein